MKTRAFFILFVLIFAGFCSVLVVKSGVFDENSRAKTGFLIPLAATGADNSTPAGQTTISSKADNAFNYSGLRADSAAAKTVTLGSTDPASGFKFQLELTSKGASIYEAQLSEYSDLDPENPKPFVIITGAKKFDGTEKLPMANGDFVFIEQGLKLALDKLNWATSEVTRQADGSEKVEFSAVIKDANGRRIVRLGKSYLLEPGSYHLECELSLENLTDDDLATRLTLHGPVGVKREGLRIDLRKVIGGFVVEEGKIEAAKLDMKALKKALGPGEMELLHKNASARFIWAAVVNKYFAAILRPVPEAGKSYCDWLGGKEGIYFGPDLRVEEDETLGLQLQIRPSKLEARSKQSFNFQLYLGPKDKGLFDKNDLYNRLGFVHAIDLQMCCGSLFQPLSFGILSLMKWMYVIIPNYGLVIIILVLLVRLALHPITKSSQVSMMRMTKLAPKAEEIKQKYGNNKAEMQKHLMALYKEQGASPILGLLPMMLQMPIWIALYGAISSSIALRGAPFLPFWITDLSAPDALIRFSAFTIPLLNAKIDSFNLLPILLAVAMFLQQKLMPHATASANPQAAQQQKMMLVMMPIMMLLFLYKAPSGLNLYIMSSVLGGVVEQYVIRKHIKEKEAMEAELLVSTTAKTGGRAKKKKPKPFFRS